MRYLITLVFFFLVVLSGLSSPGYAGNSCTFCPPLYCENPDVAREAIERKKNNARAQGLPERLITLFDRLPPCLGCIETTPDWVHITWRVDADAFEDDRGYPPGYEVRSMPWSADVEKRVRDDMRRGVVTEYHILHYSGPPCKCCDDSSEESYRDWQGYLDAPGESISNYNEDFDFHPNVGISFTSPRSLGNDPKDLTEIPESFQRPDTLSAPPIEEFMDPPVRVVQVMCKDCQNLADEYNALGSKLNKMRSQIAELKRDLVYERQLINAVWLEIEGLSKTAYTPATGRKRDQLYDELGGHQRSLDRRKKKLDEKLEERAELELQLADVMARLKICEETQCKSVKETKTECPAPSNLASITVGPNDKVGSGAAFEDKLKSQAKGAAMGAIGGLLGGSGISLGGGSGSGQKGPKLDKDPTKGKLTDFVDNAPGLEHMAGVEAGGRFDVIGDDVFVTVDLDDVPGDGTFHALWLEDSAGNIILPTQYLIYEMYQDWKLSVWWTEDRWVDGEHVYHDEGDEVTVGRNELGNFVKRLEGEAGINNAIWHSLGFNTAKKGVKRMGAKFPLLSSLKDPCGFAAVAHVTLPDKDPVVTQPLRLKMKLPQE